jgi:hypothetical protein
LFAWYFVVDRPAPTDVRNAWASKRGTAAALAAAPELLGLFRFFFGACTLSPTRMMPSG